MEGGGRGGQWGGVGEKGRRGGWASPTSEWAGKGKPSKRSPCCQISAFYELEDIIILLSSVTVLQLLEGTRCGQGGASLGGGRVRQRLVGAVSWALVPNSSTLFSLWFGAEIIPQMTLAPLHSLILQNTGGLHRQVVFSARFGDVAGDAAPLRRCNDAPGAHIPIPPSRSSSRQEQLCCFCWRCTIPIIIPSHITCRAQETCPEGKAAPPLAAPLPRCRAQTGPR